MDDRRLITLVEDLSRQEGVHRRGDRPVQCPHGEAAGPHDPGLYADGDTVIILFDAAATARDGVPYYNTYTWYFQMKDAKVVKAIAFFDTRDFDEFWKRVSPEQ